MVRKVYMGLIILFTAILQCCVFQIFSIASIKPNLLLLLTVSFGLMRGRLSGLLTGFFSGLAVDILFPGQIGFHALIYMWIGFLAGLCYRIFYDDDIKMPLLLVSGGELLFGLYCYTGHFLLRGRIHFLYYLRRIMIPELLYTLIVTIVFYRLIYKLNNRLNKTDKRSIDSLV